MRPVIADPVCHEGDLDIVMLIDEGLNDRFEEFDPFLEGIQTGRPEKEKGFRVYREPGPFLEFDEIVALRLHHRIVGPVVADQRLAPLRIYP